MQNEAKVVPIGHNTAASAFSGTLPPLLIQLRDTSSLQIKKHLQELFTLADDSLFVMAERATSNSQQNALFEAMRDLRLKRKNLERSFMQELADNFSQLCQRSIGRRKQTEQPSMDSLSLVQNDELEESVAIDTMTNKVMNRDMVALNHLTSRISQILQRNISVEDNPLGPKALSTAFLEACNILGFDIEIKLIILKLFEKALLDNIQDTYQDANELLVKAGVLPALETTAPVRKRQSASPAPAADAMLAGQLAQGGSAESMADSGQTLIAFHELQSLLGQLRASRAIAPVPADAVPISTQDLMRLLSHLQQHSGDEQHSNLTVRKQLDGILQRASQQSKRTRVVGEIDNDVINLVSMLFDFILDDRSIPGTLKALIGRMQIPLLKLAVLDKSFFDNNKHPARLLLNEIGAAALGWNDQDAEHRDNLYQKIETIVQRLQHDFTDNPEIFTELFVDFANFIRSERRRSEMLEQRIRDAEEGRARSELARSRVEDELNTRLVGKTLPETVVQILQESWSKVMLLIHLKHGEESSEWQHCLGVMDRLIWSVCEHDAPDTLSSLSAMVPQLLQDLHSGFAAAALDPFASSMLFTKLEVLHVQALQRAKTLLEPPPASQQAEEKPVQPEPIKPEEVPEPLQQAAEQLLQQPQTEETPMVEIREEIALSEKPENESETRIEEDHPGLAIVDKLTPGGWFELSLEGQPTSRCKLAAIIKTTGRYIFVNRRGLKVLEKNRADLAVAFSQGTLSVLDDSQLFDRALESVISDLRRLKVNE